jgi:serine/threonine-protein kinase RsbW
MHGVDTLSVPGTLSGVGEAIEAFSRFGRAHGVPPGAIWRVQLALDEILSNIVRHAYRGGGGAIDMTFSVGEDNVVEVEIVDAADAFNPLQAPAPDTTSALAGRAPGGHGIALVRGLMDAATYERREHRNHFVMRCGPHADR